ncbi:MAG: peptidase bacteriocin processing [Caulobacteraceae bacterium]|nr:peptidase bacteriocin processing [Caulobacteraceae bacterium]
MAGRPPAISGVAAAAILAAAVLAPSAGQAKAVRSLLELRNEGLVRQQWDLSCGAAAVATLMTYQLGDPVSEKQAALGMLQVADARLVRARLGFSLLDLKRFAASRGFAAAGFAGLTLEDLLAMAPVVAPIRVRGFGHFVVVRGRRGDRLLLGDPAFGNRTMPVGDFLKVWTSRVGFIVYRPDDPHPANRMGAPPELFTAPTGAAVREAAVNRQSRGGAP